MSCFFLAASRTSCSDLDLPTVIGRVTPGNNTMLRKGRIGNFFSSRPGHSISGDPSISAKIVPILVFSSVSKKMFLSDEIIVNRICHFVRFRFIQHFVAQIGLPF